jgi:hypothetical protein
VRLQMGVLVHWRHCVCCLVQGIPSLLVTAPWGERVRRPRSRRGLPSRSRCLLRRSAALQCTSSELQHRKGAAHRQQLFKPQLQSSCLTRAVCAFCLWHEQAQIRQGLLQLPFRISLQGHTHTPTARSCGCLPAFSSSIGIESSRAMRSRIRMRQYPAA